jgi:hypothetical protein
VAVRRASTARRRFPRAANAFLTLLSNGAYLTGAYSLGPEAGEWMQLATPAIRAQVPLAVLIDTIQPLPSFSGIYDSALKELSMSVADMPPAARPMAPRCPAFRPE